MKTVKNKKWILALAIVVGVAPVLVAGINNGNARGVDSCVSDECREAKAKADEAEANASKSMDAAKMYEMTVQQLAADISAQEAKIDQTEDKIDELKESIETTKVNLKKKQEALAELLVNAHFESNKEPIRILAGSESISDLAEKASRGDTAKQQIGSAAEAVRNTKEKLENDKKEVENLLKEQQETRKSLVSMKKEQTQIKEQYEADASAFEEEAKAAREKQWAEEEKFRQENIVPDSGGYYASSNFYPYAGNCPQDRDAYPDRWRYFVCECVSYAAWQVDHHFGQIGPARSASPLYDTWGNAYSWASEAISEGYVVDHNPAPNTVGQAGAFATWNGRLLTWEYGHVFWVESVDADGVNISEYNGGLAGDFTSSKIPFPKAYVYNYIHFN